GRPRRSTIIATTTTPTGTTATTTATTGTAIIGIIAIAGVATTAVCTAGGDDGAALRARAPQHGKTVAGAVAFSCKSPQSGAALTWSARRLRYCTPIDTPDAPGATSWTYLPTAAAAFRSRNSTPLGSWPTPAAKRTSVASMTC